MKESREFVMEDGVLKKYCGPGGHVVIPEGVTGIGNSAFRDCTTLTGVTLPNSVTHIEDHAFTGCAALTSVTIPANADFIDWAFVDCPALTEILVDEENPYLASVDGVLFSKDKTVLYAYPGGKAGAYAIPNSVSHIAACAFSGCAKLTHVTISRWVRRIEDWVFENCRALTGVAIPDSVENINAEAFSGCVSLKRVTIPDSVKRIYFSAFAGCTALEEVRLPAKLLLLDNEAFAGCTALTRVTFPKSIERMEEDVFWGCPLLPWDNETVGRRGVFWVVDGQLLAFPFQEGDRVGTAKSGKTYNHKKLWETVRPKGCKEPFDYYPRGRVELSKPGVSLLYMSPHVEEDLIPEIKAAFGLGSDPIVNYDYSQHYWCHLDEGYRKERLRSLRTSKRRGRR